jgi:hypothetical protein
MSLHINKFIDLVKACESRSQRDVTMSISDAKNLHADITKLLLRMQAIQDAVIEQQSTVDSGPITVEIQGGSF